MPAWNPSWAHLGLFWGLLGFIFGILRAVLGTFLDEVKSPKMWNGRSTPRGSHKGLLGTLLGLILACLGAFWNLFSVVLGPSWPSWPSRGLAILAFKRSWPFGLQKGPKIAPKVIKKLTILGSILESLLAPSLLQLPGICPAQPGAAPGNGA